MFVHVKPKKENTSKIAVQKKETTNTFASPNATGVPATMKARLEGVSGFSFDDVNVHYNSGKPAHLQAPAYTQDNQIHVTPRPEAHLRLQDANGAVVQMVKLDSGKLNVAGEEHPESEVRRTEEKRFCNNKTSSDNYWTEWEFMVTNGNSKRHGDPYPLRVEQFISLILGELNGIFKSLATNETSKITTQIDDMCRSLNTLSVQINDLCVKPGEHEIEDEETKKYIEMKKPIEILKKSGEDVRIGWENHLAGKKTTSEFPKLFSSLYKDFTGEMNVKKIRDFNIISKERSVKMDEAANSMHSEKGVWKIGDKHRSDMERMKNKKYNLVSRTEFNYEYDKWEKTIDSLSKTINPDCI